MRKESAQDPQADLAALLGVELAARECVAPYRRRNEAAVVVAVGKAVPYVRRFRSEGVDEVDARAWRNVREHRPFPARYGRRHDELVPPNVWDLVRLPVLAGRRDPDDPSGNEPQTFVTPELLAHIEEQLHSEADSEKRSAAGTVPTHRVNQLSLVKAVHAVGEGADPRQDQTAGLFDRRRRVRHNNFGAYPLERPANTEEVAEPIVDD